MAGSGDELAAGAGDRNLLRASDADREHVVAVLKAAFVQGRLTKDEFDFRVTRVFASRTYAGLGALIADIPAEMADGRARPRSPEPAPQPNSKNLIQRGTAVGAAAGMVIPAVFVIAAGGPPAVALFLGVLASALIAVLLPGFLTLLSWVIDRGSSRKPLPPSAAGQGHQRLAPADPAGSPSQSSQEPPHTAEAGRRRVGMRMPAQFVLTSRRGAR
jgi:hypothetical protein